MLLVSSLIGITNGDHVGKFLWASPRVIMLLASSLMGTTKGDYVVDEFSHRRHQW